MIPTLLRGACFAVRERYQLSNPLSSSRGFTPQYAEPSVAFELCELLPQCPRPAAAATEMRVRLSRCRMRAADERPRHRTDHLQRHGYGNRNRATFAKGRDFAAWLGLVPKRISTGDRTI